MSYQSSTPAPVRASEIKQTFLSTWPRYGFWLASSQTPPFSNNMTSATGFEEKDQKEKVSFSHIISRSHSINMTCQSWFLTSLILRLTQCLPGFSTVIPPTFHTLFFGSKYLRTTLAQGMVSYLVYLLEGEKLHKLFGIFFVWEIRVFSFCLVVTKPCPALFWPQGL